jgi:excisionase family DNA binding protein
MELLTIRQTIEILGVTRSTIYRWEQSGILVPVRIGGVVRFRRTDIDALISPKDVA